MAAGLLPWRKLGISLMRKETPMSDQPTKDARPQTPDDRMSREEKDALIDKTEELEGPDPREVRGDEKKRSNDPGVSHS
jgi:hypothetical protein